MPPEQIALQPQEIADRLGREVDLLSREIGEIELLVQQAKAEAGRHEQRRAQLADRARTAPGQDGGEAAELMDQLLSLTRRSAIMEAQVDVLEGKLKILSRFRESLTRYAGDLERAASAGGPPPPRPVPDRVDPDAPLPPAVSRVVQTAQEDLRREIARAMHDGPAQSLTNIVLQVQIVERLLDRDPKAARGELDSLVAMVQQTLDATKAFIFDVRPMVLDDLGLVPTLRRVARDRGRRSQIPIEFESFGQDRRLSMDVESVLFRTIDEAVTGYLAVRPDRIAIRLDWSDQIEAHVAARRDWTAQPDSELESRESHVPPSPELPAALRAMIEEQRSGAARAREAAPLTLPSGTWREIQQRAETIGIAAELRDEGREVVLVVHGR